ncbi:MAG: U32 family peptidase [Lachnospiraceae bacterium]|nr:U32 family peptidase [Lachnospiraceae bacterium]
MKNKKKPELLCPASSLEVLKCAVRYGADAIYIGGEAFGLRAKAKNFSHEDMAEGIAFAHEHGVRVHVTANILAHNYDLDGARKYFEELKQLGPDALIVADPGMYSICREVWPEAEIHISTQANNTNYETYKFWWRQGAKRVVSARELSLSEIAQIRDNIPDEMEIESFVHGAMCISYSGRCLLSNFFTGRDANHGACTHPCRWKYNVFENENDGELRYAVEEDSRKGEYLPVFENERGTYIFNSRDLCMIDHVPDLVKAGIDSWKIEGRMKTALYVATVARTYRRAIDDYFENPKKYEENLPWYKEQIAKCTYRKFCTGFFYGKPDEDSQIYDNNTYSSDAIYLAMTEDTAVFTGKDKKEHEYIYFEQKNKFSVGDEIEIMKPDGRDVKTKVLEMYHVCDGSNFEKEAEKKVVIEGKECIEVSSCPHACEKVWALLSEKAEVGDLLRQ